MNELLDGIEVTSNSSDSKVVCFHYQVGDYGSNVRITYTKTYPFDQGYLDHEKGTISEWEVEIEFSTDKSVRPGILMMHMSEIAQAVAEHERELSKNHSIVISHG
jgi:hypothetical protein